MSTVVRIVKNISKWFVPEGVCSVGQKCVRKAKRAYSRKYNHILRENVCFKNIHKNDRCFIIGTGESLLTQDLTVLSQEICIGLNLFYLHKDYHRVSPRYHIYSGLINHLHLSEDFGLKFYSELECKLKCKNFFTHFGDYAFIKKHRLFKNKISVQYVDFHDKLDYIFANGVDLSTQTFHVANVALQSILVAIYMGFKEIYLIGLDHDWIAKFHQKQQLHFYKGNLFANDGFPDWNKINGPDFEHVLQMTTAMWNQYKKIKRFCDSNNIKIYNATAGGLLDVFPRVNYKLLF